MILWLLKAFKNKEKFVFATKLLTDSTGKKMGKTENNMVSLNQTPEDMFGAVMSWSDQLIIPGFEIVTDVSLDEIQDIQKSIESGANPRDFKIRLAKEIVTLCHSQDAAHKAEENFEKTFSKGGVPDDVGEVEVARDTALIDVLLAEKIVESKTDWRRLVEDGAVTHMPDTKITDSAIKAETGVYKVGKRRFLKIKVI